VSDNGRGFAADMVGTDEGVGLGLFGMQERASYVGGRVEIVSRPGAGTTVRALIPLAEMESRQIQSPTVDLDGRNA
jgi:signal transduction histidine kinase